MKKSFVFSAALLLIAACSPQPPSTDTGSADATSPSAQASQQASETTPAEVAAAAPAGPPRVSSVACAQTDRVPPTESLPVIASEPEGWMLRADPAVLSCGPVSPEGVTCQAKPGAVFFALQDYWWYDIPAGRTATITIDQFGSPTCFLNEAG
jgi:hypothetical protein